MKKLLSKGKVIVSLVSVIAILAVSLLSLFAGGTVFVAADDETTDETVTYPISGSYDTDFVVSNNGDSVYYADNKGTKIDSFTGFATNFVTYAKGSGTQADPYIIETANEFAAVVTGNLVDANGQVFSTQYVAFKVSEDVKAFNLNNTDSTVDFSNDMTAEQVKAALEGANVTTLWKSVNPFMGKLDGSGIEVYGLKATDSYAALIPHVAYSATVQNLTIKNSYFYGRYASALVGYNNRPDGKNHAIMTYRNLVAHGNVIISNSTDGDTVDNAGILFGKSSVGDGTEMRLSDSLVYDNIAKHETRQVTYGLVGNLHRLKSAQINNCIVMDSVPHTLYYGSNAFHNSTYNNVYTNMCDGVKWYNYDGDIKKDASGNPVLDTKNGGYTMATGKKYIYQYKANGSISAWFDGVNNAGVAFVNNGTPYNKELVGPMFNVDPATVKVAADAALDGIDVERWNYTAGEYPTPKVYCTNSTGTGTVANEFFEGDGSLTTPYVITTAEELALMLTSDSLNMNFKLAKDIAINDTTAADWTKNAKKWFTSNDIPEFKGSLDGNFKTISGIYYDGNQSGDYAGLIPVVGSPAVINKLNIVDSSITANKGAAGAVAGAVGEKALMIIKFDAITVKDSVKLAGSAVNGGIVGHVGYSVAQFSNCLSETAGIFGDCTGFAKLNACVAIGARPYVSAANIENVNVYTTVDGDAVEGIIVADGEHVKGDDAKISMPQLGFDGTSPAWKVVANDYPAPTGVVASSEGEVGKPWTGARATKFAGGTGTAADPWQIETAEQLALAVWQNNNGKHFILTADIYLNDVNSPLWADKVGCNQWYTQRTTQSYSNFKSSVLDGDGHVVYGLFFDHTGPQPEYVRVGLIPQLAQGSTIKNIAMSQAYLNMNRDITSDHAGVLVGTVDDWNSSRWYMEAKNASANAIKRQDPEFQALQPKVINCMADSSCYVSAEQAGGLVGGANGCILMENCAYYGSIDKISDNYWGGTLIGNEWANGCTIVDCVSLPQCCNQAMGGNAGQTWRTGNPEYITITWDDVYYFAKSIQRHADDGIKRILTPDDRIGEAAVLAMPGLDWTDYYEEDAEDQTTWIAVDGGTPLPSIFAKHREDEDFFKLSDRNFTPPSTTVSFMTDTDEVVVPDMVGPMYSKITLPTVTRDGYKFTGWYVFDDLSLEYPKDYFPPNNLQLYAGWEPNGIAQNFENYTDTIWDYDSDAWRLNKPGAKGGYKNKYVRNGAKSMHLLDTNTEAVDCLLNYEDMLEPGQAYTIKFWVTTDKENNPATLLTLVHNEKPVYLDTAIGAENMAVATGLKVGEWVQYSYSFTARTKWISLRATGGSSLYFDDIVVAKLDGTLNGGNYVGVGTPGSTSPNTSDAITVAVLVSAIMACAIIAVVSKKNLVEVID
ncbi:MAG: InlB B-repeat-containing protein [Clostridia bacterium]|nr:InlB B-repeat-containing protein [Clostridia bacterium]